MKSTAHIFGHPIHPMLIPYPFALLTGAVAFDAAARATGRRELAQTGRHMTDAGIVSAIAAAVPGIVDYFGSVPSGTTMKRNATIHAVANVTGLALFAAARAARREDGELPSRAFTLTLVATGLMSLAGWLGGELVYRDHVAVVEPEEEAGRMPGRLTQARGA